MSKQIQTVVGIDVGGQRKGFHAVALQDGQFVEKTTDTNPGVIADWCLNHSATVVSVDAPCGWSNTGSSRLAERDLYLFEEKIFCFATPTLEKAINHDKGFYNWVLNGEKLYMQLRRHYQLFDSTRKKNPVCFETFPHVIVCALAGRVISSKPKAKVRREALQNRGYDTFSLANIDFVDAALCAIAAEAFCKDNYQSFGNSEEGFIVVPTYRSE